MVSAAIEAEIVGLAPEDRAYEPPTASIPVTPRYEAAPLPNRSFDEPRAQTAPQPQRPGQAEFRPRILQYDDLPGDRTLRPEELTRRGADLREATPGATLRVPFVY